MLRRNGRVQLRSVAGHDEAYRPLLGTAEAPQKAERIAALQKVFGLVP